MLDNLTGCGKRGGGVKSRACAVTDNVVVTVGAWRGVALAFVCPPANGGILLGQIASVRIGCD